MDKKESFNRICQNKVFLLETLSVEAEIILQHVQQAEIITKRDYMNLSDVPQREKRVINLLDKLMGKGEEACRRFIELLRQDSILEMFPELKDHAVISSPAMTSPVQEVCQYNIAQIPRGTCVIINNVHFATLKERMGSDVDQNDRLVRKCCNAKFLQICSNTKKQTYLHLRQPEEHLEKIFRWLGFEVVAHRNKTAAEMKNLLKDVGKTVDGDCFVCCVLSHGIKEGVCGTDGAVISVDEIREPFNGINCKRLVGKPKMFFIQACRGGKNQDRVQVQADSSEDGESEMEVDGDDFDITIPADTDFLIARSTIDGHLCYRRPEEGSWFIQSLCRNLEQHCPLGTDIQTVLLCVNNEVSNQGFKCKQMPVHEVAMRKKLVLLPP